MVDYINDNGGIASMNGAKIEVVYGDNTSDTTVCVTVADRVFSDESVMFALGAGSSTLLLPMLPSVEKYQAPILTNNTADSITEQGYRYVFRCNIKGSQEAGYKTDFLNWLIAEKGYSADKVAVIYSDTEQGRSAGNAAKEMYESIGAIPRASRAKLRLAAQWPIPSAGKACVAVLRSAGCGADDTSPPPARSRRSPVSFPEGNRP